MINISLIYCKISEFTEDKITVAGLFYNDSEIHFIISQRNLSVLKGLVESAKYKLIEDKLRGLKNNYNYMKRSGDYFLYESVSLNKNLLDAANKCNNSIVIQEPFVISKEMTTTNIEIVSELFLGIVDNSKKLPSTKQWSKLKSNFHRKTENYLSRNFAISDKIIPNFGYPTIMEFAGKNGHLIIGDFLSAHNDNGTMLHKIRSIVDISKKIKDFDNDSSIYLISDMFEIKENEGLFNKLKEEQELEIVNSTLSDIDNLISSIQSKNPIPLAKYISEDCI